MAGLSAELPEGFFCSSGVGVDMDTPECFGVFMPGCKGSLVTPLPGVGGATSLTSGDVGEVGPAPGEGTRNEVSKWGRPLAMASAIGACTERVGFHGLSQHHLGRWRLRRGVALHQCWLLAALQAA